MSDADPAAATTTDPDPRPGADEVWVFGGNRVHGGKRVVAWIPDGTDPPRESLYKPARVGTYAIGCRYVVRVDRTRGASMIGRPHLVTTDERAPEPLRTQLWAKHRAADVELARRAVERRYSEDDALDAAIAPLLDLARPLSGTQRTALLAHVIRKVTAIW